MGYRSDVTYAIEFKDLETKRKFVAVNKLHPQFIKALKECEGVDTDNLFIIYEANFVKWYETYEDVSWHMDMLSAIEEEETEGVAAKFIRIGEEHDDIEVIEYQGDQDNNPMASEIDINPHIVTEIINNLPRSNQAVTTS
jgi:hypothetical protein